MVTRSFPLIDPDKWSLTRWNQLAGPDSVAGTPLSAPLSGRSRLIKNSIVRWRSCLLIVCGPVKRPPPLPRHPHPRPPSFLWAEEPLSDVSSAKMGKQNWEKGEKFESSSFFLLFARTKPVLFHVRLHEFNIGYEPSPHLDPHVFIHSLSLSIVSVSLCAIILDGEEPWCISLPRGIESSPFFFLSNDKKLEIDHWR